MAITNFTEPMLKEHWEILCAEYRKASIPPQAYTASLYLRKQRLMLLMESLSYLLATIKGPRRDTWYTLFEEYKTAFNSIV